MGETAHARRISDHPDFVIKVGLAVDFDEVLERVVEAVGEPRGG